MAGIDRLGARHGLGARRQDFGRSTLVCFVARLSALARIACEDASPAPLAGSLQIAAGRGLGWVETARGMPRHHIDLDGERVKRYRIVPPTEWDFDPAGPVPAAMLGVHELSPADLHQRTDWLLQLLDPCVAYRQRIDHE